MYSQKYFSIFALLFTASTAWATGVCNDSQILASPETGAVSELNESQQKITGKVDLYEAKPQPLPTAEAEIIYTNIAAEIAEKHPKGVTIFCDPKTLVCQVQLVNFSCETKGVLGWPPTPNCYYGLKGKFSEAHSQPIFNALLKSGFVRDCNHEFLQTCELDIITELSCKSTPTENPKVQNYSCTIEL